MLTRKLATQYPRVLWADACAWEVRFTVRVIRQFTYTLRLVREGSELTWTLLEGVFRSNDGRWCLTSTPDGQTHAQYSIEVQMGMYVPGNIVHSLVDRGLPKTLGCFKAEAERRSAAER